MNSTLDLTIASSAPDRNGRTRPFYWSVRRELWENRSIYLAPLSVGGVFLIGFLISTIRRTGKVHDLWIGVHQHDLTATPYDIVSGVMMLTTMLVRVVVWSEAWYGERR